MKKLTKSTAAIILAFLLVFSGTPLSGFVGLDFEIPEWLKFDWFSMEAGALSEGIYTYSVDAGEAAITGCASTANGEIIIPSELGGYTVSSIGDTAFSECYRLTSISIPDSVKSIGNGAFAFCAGLTSVTIPASVNSIGFAIFAACDSLTSITVDERNIYYSSSFYVLFNKDKSQLIQYPGGKTGGYTIPDSVTIIGEGAFYECTGLTSVTIPASVITIGNYAFFECIGLTSITIPISVTRMGDFVFYDCMGLTSITLGTGLTSIGNSVFYGCEGLTSIIIPDSVTSIGDGTFSGCSGLTDIIVTDSNMVYASEAGVLFNKSKSILIQYPAGKTGHYVIPNSVTSIGDSAFHGCRGLTSVIIPISVASIGDEAFDEYNDNLEIVAVTDSAAQIYADENDITFVSVQEGFNLLHLPNKATYLLGQTLDMTGILLMYLGESASVTIIDVADCIVSGYDAELLGAQTVSVIFNGETINFDINVLALDEFFTYVISENQAAIIDFNGLFSGELAIPSTLGGCSVTSIGECSFENCTGLTNITIPNSVTSIGDSAFENCTGLTNITIPNGVTSIGDSAFLFCTGLTSVDLGTGVTSIGDSVFLFCSGLTSITVIAGNPLYSSDDGVLFNKNKTEIILCPGGKTGGYTIPDGVNTIGYFAFVLCSGLTSITIPNSVTSIGGGAFSCCRNLESITIPNSVTSIGYLAFNECARLTSITIPDSVTSIEGETFFNCWGLTSITIPNSVKSIGDDVFYACYSLISITIPNSVTSIGDDVFRGCYGLKSITVAAGNPSYSSDNGVLLNKNMTHIIQCPGGKTGGYTIPDTVTSMEDGAFSGCNALTSIFIPNSVTSIGNHAFQYCMGLTSVILGTGVTSIGDSAFSECSGLISITIPNSVTSIGDYAFSGCTDLTSTTIPSSVTSIGDDAFSDCTGLTIYCFENSTAQTYATSNSIPYELIYFSVSSGGPGCNIDYANKYITGLSGGITSLEGYFAAGSGYELQYVPTQNGYGTGTVVNAVSTAKNAASNSIVATYTVVIYGDVNGDGVIDIADSDMIIDIGNYALPQWDPVTDAANIKAGDLFRDGVIDENDCVVLKDVQNLALTLDQYTGEAT